MKWILIMWVYYNGGLIEVGTFFSEQACREAAVGTVVFEHDGSPINDNQTNASPRFACVPAKP